jgi:hypothetical protein
MAPKERQKIEIEKTHRDPLLSFNQPVTVDCSDFLGTALKGNQESAVLKLEFVDFFDIYGSVQLEQRRIIGKKTDPICRFRKF